MPAEDLRIALIPHNIVPGNVSANLDIVEQRISTLEQDTDLIVLPEMFNTGFTADTQLIKSYAENDSGITIQCAKRWAAKTGAAIWGGFTAGINGKYYNRGFMIMPDGETRFYNKRHLFQAGGENQIFTPGMELSPIVPIKGWNLKMSICYDIRFPEWNRNIANNYDALIVPANWAHARFHAWKHLLMARAIENQAFVAGCNREGNDAYGTYDRYDSQIFDHMGQDIAERKDDGTLYATFLAKRFTHDRSKFRPWVDADKFRIIID